MGASASKSAGAAARQYPKRPPPTSSPSTTTHNALPATSAQAGPVVRPPPRASTTRDAGINADASDPDLARHLRRIGPVQPNPTYSQTSTFDPASAVQTQAPSLKANPAVLIFEARMRIQEQAEKEFARGVRDGQGRQFLDPYTIRQILVQRDEQGKTATEIEKTLGLRAGVVARLGPPGMLGLVTEVGRSSRGVDMV